jgi:hypothetical protein
MLVYVGSLVNGNQKTIDPLTGISAFLAISTGLNVLGTGGIRYCFAPSKGAAASAADSPPITFKKSRLDKLAFLVGVPPSNSFVT